MPYGGNCSLSVGELGLHFAVTLREVRNIWPMSAAKQMNMGRFLLWGRRQMASQCDSIIDSRSVKQFARDIRNMMRRLAALTEDETRRLQFSFAARNSYINRYSPESHRTAWRDLLETVSSTSGVVKRRRISFAFANPDSPSGQREATKLIWTQLPSILYDINLVPLPAWNRGRHRATGWLHALLDLSLAFWCGLGMVFRRNDILHVTLAQTFLGMLRDCGSFYIFMRLGGAARTIVSLNGSNFLKWRKDSVTACLFRSLAGGAAVITVVSSRQKDKLVELGIPITSIEVVSRDGW